ncbi:putative choline binding protein [Streptococcus sp. DD10]|uniref:SH3 domain-containing protein n=1 Tax=Streptococcus sp. DD10 TaxID=1777878 RepID=UPI000792D00F|nr:SH3 domain-containing protein [Streptococcus sp. DD10]KXT74849.1 putative choline binding protein [Streptococcus sp. DD10]
MKQGQKFILFSSVVLGSVIANQVTAQADTVKSQATESQIIEKSNQASAEDLQLAKTLFVDEEAATKPSRTTTPAINTLVIEKEVAPSAEQTALAEKVFSDSVTSTPAKEEAEATKSIQPVEDKKEAVVPTSVAESKENESINSENQVSISLEGSVASIQYEAPKEEKVGILHAIWSEENGRDDIEWLPATGSTTKVDFEKHGGYGSYHINSYKEVAGNLMLFNKAVLDYKAPVVEKNESEKPQVEVSAQVDGDNLKVGLKRSKELAQALIQYAVWSEENGRDDIQWYVAKETTTIDLSKHKGYGIYHLATYAWLDGAPVGLATTDFTYEKKETPKSVEKEKESGLSSTGTYTFTGRASIKNEASLASPEVAYFDKGMSVYYDKVLENEGHQWLGYVSYTGKRHYVDLGAIASTPAPIVEKKVERKVVVTPHIEGNTLTIDLKRSADLIGKDIKHAVWSAKNDQDDIVWYLAGESQTKVDLSKHKDFGTYFVHTYLFEDGKAIGLNGTTIDYKEDLKPVKEEKKTALPSTGTYTFTDRASIKNEARLTSPEVAYFDKGMSVYYDKVLENEGHQWLGYVSYTGKRYYVDLGATATTPASTVKEKKEEVKVSIPSSGSYTFTEKLGIKSEPKVDAQELAFYDKGMTVNYDKTLVADGKEWISYLSYSGNRRYIAVGTAGQEKPASSSQSATPKLEVKDEPTNLVAARLAFAQHGLTSTFDVEVTEVTGKGSLHFAVWNGQNDQDDLKWYDMKRVGDKFIGSFDINQHRGNGPLYIHAYYQEAPGAKMQFVRGLQF